MHENDVGFLAPEYKQILGIFLCFLLKLFRHDVFFKSKLLIFFLYRGKREITRRI